MAKARTQLKGDQRDILVSYLRGEVGEVITTWTYLRETLNQIETSESGDLESDLRNRALIRLNNLRDRFADDIVARLSELAQQKLGRTNFHSVRRAYPHLATQIQAYRDFVIAHDIHARRNKAISHKELPTHWLDRNVPIPIDYKVIVKAIVLALSLMKLIDFLHLGPACDFLWLEMRTRRYIPQHPPRHAYTLLPYYHLSGDKRLRVVEQEVALGFKVWEPMYTSINGRKARVTVCKRWGVIALPDRLLATEHYPIVSLDDMQIS